MMVREHDCRARRCTLSMCVCNQLWLETGTWGRGNLSLVVCVALLDHACRQPFLPQGPAHMPSLTVTCAAPPHPRPKTPPECPTPEEVAHEIASHVKATRSLPARCVLRLVPVSFSCFASKDELAALTPELLHRFFPAGEA